MLAAYRMKLDESQYYLKKLKQLAEDARETEGFGDILSVYVRTLIASPSVSAEELKENLFYCNDYIKQSGMVLKNIMPTSNSHSIMNGGIDLLALIPYQKALYPVLKPIITKVLDKEGVGVADASIGELLYEQNKSTQAMSSLTRALSDANLRGSIRVQYAITGIMSRLLQSEGQLDTSKDILENIYNKAEQENFNELLPNIYDSIIQCALLEHDVEKYTQWLETQAPNEYATFYINARYRLFMKARVYAALGRDLEAIYIIEYLETYVALYHRTYMAMELSILKAMILYRRKEEWKPILMDVVERAQKYHLVRVLSDQGAALLPLWKQIQWKEEGYSKKYITEVTKDLEEMAKQYPKYLEIPLVFGELTERELDVLRILSKGANNTQIAEALSVSLGTVKFHVSNIIKKLHAGNRTEVVEIAKEHGII